MMGRFIPFLSWHNIFIFNFDMFFATFPTYFLNICSILSLSPIMANRPTSHFLLPFHCFYHIVAISFHIKFSSFPLTFSSLHPFTLLPFFHFFIFLFFQSFMGLRTCCNEFSACSSCEIEEHSFLSLLPF